MKRPEIPVAAKSGKPAEWTAPELSHGGESEPSRRNASASPAPIARPGKRKEAEGDRIGAEDGRDGNGRRGRWYAMCTLMFLVAVACTCYAVCVGSASGGASPSVSNIAVSAGSFRTASSYGMQGPDELSRESVHPEQDGSSLHAASNEKAGLFQARGHLCSS